MGSETFSDFLIPLKFNVDDASKKKFDSALAETEKKFAAIGAAAGAAAVALGYAIREISKNLSDLAYSAERVGASSEELKALGNAAERVGIGAETAKSSLSAFFAFVNFEGGASAIKQWFNIDFDPKHPLKAMLDSAVKLADEYTLGGAKRQTAIVEARRAGINETLLTTPGAARRLRDEMEKDKAYTGGALNPIAEEAKRLNADFRQIEQHLRTIGELVMGSLQDAFSNILETVDGWLKARGSTGQDDSYALDHPGWHPGMPKEQTRHQREASAAKLDHVDPALVEIFTKYAHLTAELWNQYEITQKINATLKGIGEVLKSFWDGSIAGKINSALEWAFQPFKWLWDKLQSLGLVGPSAFVGGGGVVGFGPGEGTESGGHGSVRRGKFGHGGSGSGRGGAGGPEGKGGVTANTSAAMAAAEAQLRAEGVPEANVHAAAALLVGQATAESGLDPTTKHDFNSTTGTFGYGVYGASAIRKGPMFAWMAAHGFARDSLEGQIKYMAHEAMTVGDYAATRRALMQATPGSIDRDTRIITPNFEGPRIDNSGHRVGLARSALGSKAIAKSPITEHLPIADFHKTLDSIRLAKPLAPWQQSMNEHHDNRAVHSNIEVKVAGEYPVDKTKRPLERTKNAALIRNTTSTSA